MKFKGNRRLLVSAYSGLFASIITAMIMIDDKKLGLVLAIISIILASITYLGFIWIKEIEISDNLVTLNRILWSNKIKISDIITIKFTRRKFIIVRKNNTKLEFYLDQIDQRDIKKFYEYTEQHFINR